MTSTRYFACKQISDIRDDLILEAEIPADRIQRCMRRRRLGSGLSRMTQNSWFVAVVCAVVSFSVVAWIVYMGQRDPSVLPPPAESIEEPDTPSENDTETAPLSEEEQIKQQVLDFMTAGDAQKDPGELFSHFAGDFSVSDVKNSYDGITSVQRKGAVMIAKTPNVVYYGIEAAGAIYYAAYFSREAEMVGHLTLKGDIPERSTIFTVFGMDTSALYGVEAEGTELPLTAEMLTVSEDKRTCLFSDAYMDGLAKELCSAMGFTEDLTRDLLDQYQGSGVYSVEENKVTFTIELDDAVLGKIYQNTSYAVDAEGKVQVSTQMSYSNPTLGIKTPIESRIQYQDVVYRNGAPISGTVRFMSTEDASYYEGDYQGAPYITAVKTVVTQYDIDVSDSHAPKATAECEIRMQESYQGESWEILSEISMRILPNATAAFIFDYKMGGDTVTTLRAGDLTFGTPSSFRNVPKVVTDAITEYIMKQ